MNKIKINSYWRATGDYSKTLEKDLVEYTEWLLRALERGYRVEMIGSSIYVSGGKGTRDFFVETEDLDNLDWR